MCTIKKVFKYWSLYRILSLRFSNDSISLIFMTTNTRMAVRLLQPKYSLSKYSFKSKKPESSVCLFWKLEKTVPNCQAENIRWFHVNTAGNRHQKQRAEVTKVKSSSNITFGNKVSEAGKDVTYTGVIVVGVAVTGFIFYLIGRELFSSNSPNVIFGKALKQCKNHPEVDLALGGSIKGRGEMTKRGRARHVTHWEYEREGSKFMRLQFYLIGAIRQGTAHMEVKQSENGTYETRYLFVEVDTYPSQTIIIEDNR